MRYFFLVTIFILASNFGFTQTLSITESISTNNFNADQFLIAGHKITFSNGSPAYAKSSVSSGLNSLTAVASVLNSEGVSIYSGNGNELFTASYKRDNDDSSVKVYTKPNGGFIIRENIANFLFYDTSGGIIQSVSNSSQSAEGESISELAADPAFKTVVLYNPKIISNGTGGSRARIITGNWTTRDIFYRSDRAIRLVKVSDNGQFVAIASYASGTDDAVEITDRFGNEMGTFEFDQEIADLNFSNDGKYITIRSNGRVAVYSVLTGERAGSTSFRSKLYFADYVPQDDTIIALIGDQSGTVLNDIEIHAINLSARSIERQSYGSSLGISSHISPRLNRTGSMSYTLVGLSKVLNLNIRN